VRQDLPIEAEDDAEIMIVKPPVMLLISGWALSGPCSLMEATAFFTIVTASSLVPVRRRTPREHSE
jgi:hypothetical protein